MPAPIYLDGVHEREGRSTARGRLNPFLAAMNLIAAIKLYPSFHDMHEWSVDLLDDRGEVVGTCPGARGTWRLSDRELAAVPGEVRSGWFPDNDYNRIGCDGISVSFSITTDTASREKMIWCPEHSVCPEYAALLHWSRSGLYQHSADEYRVRLEQLYSYFNGWGIPVRRTGGGLRIFGMLSSPDEPELRRCFEEVVGMSAPEIDMSNFENTGTLLYPVFKRFFQRAPGSRWRVNAAAHRHVKQAGIPESSMVLGQTGAGGI